MFIVPIHGLATHRLFDIQCNDLLKLMLTKNQHLKNTVEVSDSNWPFKFSSEVHELYTLIE